MSGLCFEKVPARAAGMGLGSGFRPGCQVRDCFSAGKYRTFMVGRPAGLVCGRHRTEWQRAWDREAA